ncbi:MULTISPECIES: amidohydrolase family protein [Amycolatopsis]|uniref:Predicted metal-dependent hydrolase, TIM-barrel fold n=2 Tax=Amycolatopsis TaxID=1813 RepID=A0A1I3WR96_9PSEU|nr:amidohydrolase family protein [Amycolatopsis sacchari]SFK08996.1 Predicted metal-dependent hydrolase, TIM-barrel fold [Amycolatopsis sacchari]
MTGVPYTTQTAPPALRAGPLATDTHHHIFDDRFPGSGPKPPQATAEDYRSFRTWLGLSRSVVVAPSNYGTDHLNVLESIAELGPDVTRGVVIVDPDVDLAELWDLHAAGVRGVRVYLTKNRVPTADELRVLARKVADRGWVMQLVAGSGEEVLPRWEDVVAALPCRVVIDHLGWTPQPAGADSATAHTLFRLAERGHVYVKISGFYLSSVTGPPTYSDVDTFAATVCRRVPERVVWGTDWPHPVAFLRGETLPDDAALLDRLAVWLPDEADRERVLADTPTSLYWCD